MLLSVICGISPTNFPSVESRIELHFVIRVYQIFSHMSVCHGGGGGGGVT